MFSDAARHYWATLQGQATDQINRGGSDQGGRGAVTGGKQMDGFLLALYDVLDDVGVEDGDIQVRTSVTYLPGFYRPTKRWDLLVVSDGILRAAVELKSQAGSFGNNFNNRVEEAIGNAEDLWTAYRENAFAAGPQPFVGFLFLLEDHPKSRSPVRVYEPHFDVFPE